MPVLDRRYESSFFTTACAIVFGLAGLAVSIWLGIALLTGESPMDTKNVAGGATLIAFCWLAAIFSAVIGAAIGTPIDCCVDCCDNC